MKDLDYSVEEIKQIEKAGFPIRATVFYWDNKKSRVFDVERFDLPNWIVVLKAAGAFRYVSINTCEFTLIQPFRYEDLRKAPRPNSK